MKRLVDGVEVELVDAPDVAIQQSGDRLVVRTPAGARTAVAVRVGDAVHVSYQGRQYVVEKASRTRTARPNSTGEIHAPMPGLIVDVFVLVGATVAKGQKLLVLEAMKTQQTYVAPFDGVIEKLPVVAGDQVIDGALLAFVAETIA